MSDWDGSNASAERGCGCMVLVLAVLASWVVVILAAIGLVDVIRRFWP